MQDLVPEEPIEWLPEKNLIKFYSYLKIKNFCCNRAYKISDDFENIEEILEEFSKQIIIRSNSSKEDTNETSSAGKFLSIGPLYDRRISD